MRIFYRNITQKKLSRFIVGVLNQKNDSFLQFSKNKGRNKKSSRGKRCFKLGFLLLFEVRTFKHKYDYFRNMKHS